ncbi:putative sugar ABC transporter ATP-binding protein [Salinarchaeum sp. Harcht-Bsk1]|uniref:ABC transporter ATP-binding protein n=1 Tax=Salinarchaeum sp. Harcht-Bsk1 TaxID=1333523 RepID=UPI000342478D|nr:ABC transporter ATP-binding protein [Salinarchaeum sp. Harcht-Bsk1]AGN02755.1 putative sugar ABC transporter ATP-binding protein [Salinarchaeum sp. Harcht-Bsk1]
MAEVTLDSVTKVFQDGDDQVVAVDDVSLSIDDGEFLVLVGPSGCGKSTTLRMIAGLETVTSGTITIGDDVVNHVPAQHRDIAMVFQSYALYPHMTVRENMAFGLEESTTLERDVIDRRVEESAHMMGIDELLNRKPADLSGGQQQRVALGRAIVRDPEVFLMDEPLSNLDAKLRAQMRTELQRLQDELGTTTIYVTHDQTEAMTMGDRIAILDGGVLQQIGTPLECYHRPNNQFVAGFIGEPPMNFLNVDHEDGTLVNENVEYSLPADVEESLEPGAEYVLGIRPEDIELQIGGDGGDHLLEATVDVVEPTGDENVVYLALDEAAMGEDSDRQIAVGVGDEEPSAGGSPTGSSQSGLLGRLGSLVRGLGSRGRSSAAATSPDSEGDTADAIEAGDSSRLTATVGGMEQYESGQAVTAYLPPEAIHVFDAASSAAVHNRRLDEVDRAPNA